MSSPMSVRMINTIRSYTHLNPFDLCTYTSAVTAPITILASSKLLTSVVVASKDILELNY